MARDLTAQINRTDAVRACSGTCPTPSSYGKRYGTAAEGQRQRSLMWLLVRRVQNTS